MTRARETLQLFSIAGVRNPHVVSIFGEWVSRRKLNADCDLKKPVVRHVLLGMEDLYLDFAGVRREKHPARLALARLNVGDKLHIAVVNEHLELLNTDDIPVARLSRTARGQWLPLLDRVVGVRTLAMVRRHRSMSEEKYQQRYHGDVWEVPIVEVRYR